MNHKIHLRLRRSLSAVLALMIVLLTGCANQAAQTVPYHLYANGSDLLVFGVFLPSASLPNKDFLTD